MENKIEDMIEKKLNQADGKVVENSTEKAAEKAAENIAAEKAEKTASKSETERNREETDAKIRGWIQMLLKDELNDADVMRALAYAHDLERGLLIVRTYPQGVTIFGSARLKENDKYCIAARELGGLLAQNGHAVVTGGGPGIMEAAHHGAYEYGGRTIGLNIELPHEQHINPYVTDQLEFKYFFARKVMLAMSSKVYVFFPGGFGTLDEFSEILVLMQEGKMPKMPIFLFGKSYWRSLDKFFKTKMYSKKMIGYHDTSLYKITDNIHEIVAAANRLGHPKVGENFYDNLDKLTNKSTSPYL